MSIIIRLQNLPWAADSSDIRRYFSGLSIPEGGVHIVGGEMGDAFIAFSTDEDARLAMAKDGGKIQEMQIKLLLSSRQEMARVIERARHQNLVMQTTQVMPPLQPPPFPIMQQPMQVPAPVENERRRIRSPTPPRRHSRDRSDRRRSPDSRDRGRFSSSKRERSRSPQRSSRSTNRDMDTRDRRSDRFKREDRRYPDPDSSRYSDSRHSERERYPDADHVNSRSQLFPAEAYQDNHSQSNYNHPHSSNIQNANNYSMPGNIPSNNNYLVPGGDPNSNNNYLMSGSGPNNNNYNNNYPVSSSSSNQNNYPYNYPLTSSAPKDYPVPPFATSGNNYSYSNTMSTASNEYAPSTASSSDNNYSYNNPAVSTANKNSPVPFYNNSTDDRNSLRNPSDLFNLEKSNMPGMLSQMNSSPNSYVQKQAYNASSFEKPISVEKTDILSTNTKPPQERRRKSRFEPEPEVPVSQPFLPIPIPDVLQKLGMNLNTQSVKEASSSEIKKPSSAQNFPPVTRSNWPQQNEQQKEEKWQDKTKTSQGLLKPPETKSSSQPVPMDLDPPTSAPERIVFSNQNENSSQKNFTPLSRNVLSRNSTEKDTPVRGGTTFDGNQRRGLSSSTAEVRGIPFDTRQEDILRLFRNIPLSPANVCIQVINQRAEKAFIKFGSISELEEALNSQPIFIKKSQCELIPCPVAAFEDAVASQVAKSRPKSKPREEDLTVLLKGLPFQCGENDIAQFFFGLHIIDIYIEKAPDGRCSGTCFVEFATMKDFKNALTMNGKTIGHRYITISVSSKEILEFCKSESGHPQAARVRGPPPQRPRGPPSPPINKQFINPRQINHPRADRLDDKDLPPRPPLPPKPVRGNFCIAIRGLPKGTDNTEIGEFFKEMDVSARAIHAMLDANNMPNGEAYIEVATQRELDIAISRNGKPFRGHRVNMIPIPIKELDEILGRESLPPNPPVRPLLRTPESERPPRRPLLAQAPNNGQFHEHPIDFPQDEPMRPPALLRGPRPLMDRPMRPHMERPPRSGPPFGRMRGPRPDAPGGGYPPCGYPQPQPLPGCVVSINNLHFNAGLEELLDFFSDFRVTRDHIIRRFIDKKPTGEARVSFESPREAQRAVRELNMKPIRGRSLHLSIL